MRYLKLLPLFLFISSNNWAQIDFQEHIIASGSDQLDGAADVHAADIDGDGDLDILSAAYYDNAIYWHENLDGQFQLAFAAPVLITDEAQGIDKILSVDLDGDGDVLSASNIDNKIAWYENEDGTGTFGPQQVISTAVEFALWIFASDLDNDGDMDVLSASSRDDKIAWYENTDGNGSFGPQIIVGNLDGASSVMAGDLDGDGDSDLVTTSFVDDKVRWFENTDGMGTFSEVEEFTTTLDGANSTVIVDIDGDNDLDIIAAAGVSNTILLFENTDGEGSLVLAQTITPELDGLSAITAADFDNDGDIDFATASRFDHSIAWFTNLDGLGNFSSPKILTTNAISANAVFAADLDNDDSIDILSSSLLDNKIAYYLSDGAGQFSEQQLLSDSPVGAEELHIADIDNDGDQDVLVAYRFGAAWYENLDGLGNFGPQNSLTNVSDAHSIDAADFDNDGDLDIVTAHSADRENLVWFENLDGQGSFASARTIRDRFSGGALATHAADVDNDGDQDVMVCSLFDIVWYENLNQGFFTLG